MTPRRPIQFSLIVAATFFAFNLLTSPVAAQQPATDKQIGELQKQIEALNKKLDELRQATKVVQAPPAGPTLNADWISH